MFTQYIEDIKSVCKSLEYEDMYDSGEYIVKFWKTDKGYLDGLQFKERGTFLWTYSTPEEFLKKFLNIELEYKHFVRNYGEPKLVKPDEIKNVPASFSVEYIKDKCKCSVIINKNDVWVKHKDYFSDILEVHPEDQGKPLTYLSEKYLNKKYTSKKRFAYDDCFGDIVLRNEAWIVLDTKTDYLYIKELDKIYKSGKGVFEQQIKNVMYEYGIDYLLILERIDIDTYRLVTT